MQPARGRMATHRSAPSATGIAWVSAARKNPYAAQLKKQITIRLDEDSIRYFKSISEDVGIPYQSLINLYLRDCAASGRKLNLSWK